MPSMATLLTILFVILKVFGLITWSWWLVFAPIWVPVVLIFIAAVLYAAADAGKENK